MAVSIPLNSLLSVKNVFFCSDSIFSLNFGRRRQVKTKFVAISRVQCLEAAVSADKKFTRYSVLLIEILDPTTGPEMTSCVLIVVYYGLPPWSSGYNIHPLSRNLGVRVSTGVHFSSDFRNRKHKNVSRKGSTIG